jgi:hypothetical protein
MSAKRPLLHLPALAAAGTALYAASLAFVTGQQAAADARVAAEREPMRQAAIEAGQRRERVTAAAQRAAAALEQAAGSYSAALAQSASLDEALSLLAGSVEAATGAAAALPDRIQLAAPRTTVVTVITQPPPVQATTGASGQ